MLKTLLKHSLRALARQKAYVFINVLGLSIGIACTLVIALLTTTYRTVRTAWIF